MFHHSKTSNGWCQNHFRFPNHNTDHLPTELHKASVTVPPHLQPHSITKNPELIYIQHLTSAYLYRSLSFLKLLPPGKAREASWAWDREQESGSYLPRTPGTCDPWNLQFAAMKLKVATLSVTGTNQGDGSNFPRSKFALAIVIFTSTLKFRRRRAKQRWLGLFRRYCSQLDDRAMGTCVAKVASGWGKGPFKMILL